MKAKRNVGEERDWVVGGLCGIQYTKKRSIIVCLRKWEMLFAWQSESERFAT